MLVLISLTACSIKEPRLSLRAKVCRKERHSVFIPMIFDKQDAFEQTKKLVKI